MSRQQLEAKRFGTVAIPFYAIVDPDERTIATFPGLTRNASEFVKFLRTRDTKLALSVTYTSAVR